MLLRSVCVLRPNQQEVSANFLMRALESPMVQRALVEKTKQGSQPGVYLAEVNALKIPLPLLPEQRRIAAILQDQIAAVDRARAAAEEQLKAAQSLPAAYLRAVFNSPEARQWPHKPFGQLVVNYDGRRIPLKQEDRRTRKGPFPYYGASGVIDYLDDYLFDGDYLLVSEDGANLVFRSTPIAFQASGKFWVNNHAHVVQPRGEVLLDHLRHYLNLIDLKPYLSGMAQPKLTQDDLNSIPIPVPTIEQQSQIHAQLNEQMTTAEQVIKTLESQLETMNQLPAALLRRAFNGEL